MDLVVLGTILIIVAVICALCYNLLIAMLIAMAGFAIFAIGAHKND